VFSVLFFRHHGITWDDYEGCTTHNYLSYKEDVWRAENSINQRNRIQASKGRRHAPPPSPKRASSLSSSPLFPSAPPDGFVHFPGGGPPFFTPPLRVRTIQICVGKKGNKECETVGRVLRSYALVLSCLVLFL